jgi:hypothetical protein
MWDLETIIRINSEAYATKTQNTVAQSKQEEAERDAGIWNTEDRVFKETSYLRSVYEGEDIRCPSQGWTGETLP